MGSDGEIHIFDYSRYVSTILPDLYEFIKTGHTSKWLKEILDLNKADTFFKTGEIAGCGVDFAQNCSYLNPELAYSRTKDDQWVAGWGDRSCDSVKCIEQETCPLHKNSKNAEDFIYLWEACVARECLKDSQFCGRSVSPTWYYELIKEKSPDKLHEISKYINALEFRGFVIGYAFSNSDGVHGWLTENETKEFWELLNTIELPSVGHSFDDFKKYCKANGYSIPGYPFSHLSLSFVRAVAGIAFQQNMGLLWGNDVTDPWWFQ